MTPLYGHVSQETAYLVSDYPYGSKLRCRIRFWIEQHSSRGFRFVSQTENPKSLRWNKPKQGTYCAYGMAMYLDDNNHVQHRALTPYSSADDILSFLRDFPNYVPTLALKAMALVNYRLTDRQSKGESIFTINDVPQIPKPTDIERANAELSKWREVLDLIKNRHDLKGATNEP